MAVNNSFFEEVEMLSGEVTVWEGGASKRGGLCLILESLSGLLSLALLLVTIFWFISSLSPKESEYEEVTPIVLQEATEEKATQEKVTPNKIINKDKYYKRVFINYLTVIIVVGSFLIWFSLKFVNSFRMMVTNERICIQSGVFNKRFSSVDIDKVVSVISTQPFLARFFNLHHLEIIHSGVGSIISSGGARFQNPYKVLYLDINDSLTSKILLHWLPRDNIN